VLVLAVGERAGTGDLDRDQAIQLRIAGFPYLAKRPGPDALQERELAQPLVRVGAGVRGARPSRDRRSGRLVGDGAGRAGLTHLDQVRAVGADDAHGRSPGVGIGTMLALSPAGARRST